MNETDSSAVTPVPSKIILRPRKGWQPIDFSELWHYRELLWILAVRDVKVRYKQTVLGATWAVIQPLAQMIVFLAFFSGFAPPGVPAPLFFFSGSMIWLLFTTSLSNAGNSLVGNQNLITKVYFPRLVIPISSVITSIIDFAVAFGIFIVMMALLRVAPYHMFFLFPVFVLLAFLSALASGLWLSALNVEFRDIRFVIPFIVQFWLFVTPIIYPASHVTTQWKRLVLAINPMSGVVEGFRWCMLGTEFQPWMLLVSVSVTALLLVGGLFYFRRMETSFADLV